MNLRLPIILMLCLFITGIVAPMMLHGLYGKGNMPGRLAAILDLLIIGAGMACAFLLVWIMVAVTGMLLSRKRHR